VKLFVVRSLFPFAAIACWLLIGFDGLMGAEFRSDERPTVEADEVIQDDLYIFGDEVTIDGEVKGDVIAFGRLIRVNGLVEGDFIAAGQAIVISGEVTDDVRMAGQILKIDKDAAIGDDVIAAAFSLEIEDASSIGGDLVYGGYQALLAGDIGGKIKGAMANCEISGHIAGDLDLSVDGDESGAQACTAGSPPPISFPHVPAGLTIRDTAQLDGGLKYESPDEANIAAGAQIAGKIEHERPDVQAKRPPTLAEKAWSVVRQYAALLIVGLCVVLVAPTWTRRMSDNIRTRPLASLGFGVAGIVGFIVLLVVIPVGMIILAVIAGLVKLTSLVPVVIVLGLLGVTMLVAGFWFFAIYLAEIVLGFFAGRWLLGLVNRPLAENRFLSLMVGLVLLALISSVPYLGPIVGWLAVLFGLGALVLWMFWKRPPGPAPIEKPELADE
jgi:cytoskeletal protein CcmA (bactofilin family)